MTTNDSSFIPPSGEPQGALAKGMTGRRRLLTYGLGAVAGLAGAGWGWWRMQPSGLADGVLDAFWAAQFDGIDGVPVAMQAFAGKPLLLNFWATWCPPCVEELPLLNSFYHQHRDKGWQVLGLAIDQPGNVHKFLQRMALDFPLALGQATATQFSRDLGNDVGGLPFSILFAADGSIAQRKMGQLKEDDLDRWVASL
ncbi:hypothetical protein GCM10022279_09150 [Comamonas faecalis]|uniref:Thioredoxin domain-containing protein n=1 Tax=Comamonas faecalis TaxID=1387849 RepID=A0ABP7QV20_9BURK